VSTVNRKRNLSSVDASYCHLKILFFRRCPGLGLALLAAFAVLLPSAHAAYFSAGLTDAELQATGVGQLSDAERNRLDELVGRDTEFALEGGVVAFDRTFSARLRPADFQAAGLGHLSHAQLAALDDLAAFRIAHPVAEAPHFVAKSAPKPATLTDSQIAKGAALSPSSVSSPGWHPEVHGDVHMTVGGGKGGSFYGGGVDLVMTDPDHNLTIALSYSQYHGRGWFNPDGPLADGPYGLYGPYGPWSMDPLLAGLPPGWSPADVPPVYDPEDPDAARNAIPRSALVPPH